ncbi:DUF4325 domain-containing protein [Candidatus Peregrinibacteria bacterium]|nr:DUF4325 domain-containing protein [Candidatus Peregrinibacteria bacterium]
MKIEMIKFGNLLISRPSGKDAWLSFRPQLATLPSNEEIILNFKGVSVLTPSWMDEFYTPLKIRFKKIKIINIDSPVIKETIDFLESLP